MKKKYKITTKDREIYDKFNLLHFSNEVLFDVSKNKQINKIVNCINRDGVLISKKKFDNYIVLKKMPSFNFDIYLK